jgi:hypothetical protein
MPRKIPSPLNLEPEGQQLVDRLLDTLGNRAVLTEHANLQALGEYLDQEGRMVENGCEQDHWIWAPDPDRLVEKLAEGDVIFPDLAAIRSALDDLVVKALEGSHDFWEEDAIGPILATIRHSSGPTAYLLHGIIDYGEGPYAWHGVFRHPHFVLDHVRSWGRIVTMDDYLPQVDALVEGIAESQGL